MRTTNWLHHRFIVMTMIHEDAEWWMNQCICTTRLLSKIWIMTKMVMWILILLLLLIVMSVSTDVIHDSEKVVAQTTVNWQFLLLLSVHVILIVGISLIDTIVHDGLLGNCIIYRDVYYLIAYFIQVLIM